MCGIAGFTVRPGVDEGGHAARHRLTSMVAVLSHRGPDAQRAVVADGIAFGHARLSIVDLAGGHQPMRDPETGTLVVFNGEIFNHIELRGELAAQLDVVEDLAVEHDERARLRIAHRLVPACEIDDGQPGMSERNAVGDYRPL